MNWKFVSFSSILFFVMAGCFQDPLLAMIVALILTFGLMGLFTCYEAALASRKADFALGLVEIAFFFTLLFLFKLPI